MQPTEPTPTPPVQPPSSLSSQPLIPSYGQPAPTMAVSPGKGLGIAGFVLAFFPGVQSVGLILSIIGLVKSSKAGIKNGFAIAGIVVNAVFIVLSFMALALFVIVFQGMQEQPSESRYETLQRDSIQRNL